MPVHRPCVHRLWRHSTGPACQCIGRASIGSGGTRASPHASASAVRGSALAARRSALAAFDRARVPVHLPCVDRLWRLAALEHCRGGLDDLTWGGFARLTRWRASTRGEQPPGPPLGLFKGGVPACGARRFRLVLSRLVQLRLVQRNCLRRAERCSDLKRCRGGIRVTVGPCSGRASKKKVGS